MPKHVIERTMPGTGRLSADELAAASKAIWEHASLAGLPVDAIHRVGAVIAPSTGEM